LSKNSVEKRIKEIPAEILAKMDEHQEHAAATIWQQIEEANVRSTMKPYKQKEKEGQK
jgi:hypothetical protein